MKNIFLSLTLLFSILAAAQKTYDFDYCIELDIYTVQTQKKYKHYFYINSTKPNFMFHILDFAKDTVNVNFNDVNGIKVRDSKIERTSFFKAANLEFDCKVVGEEINYYDFKKDEYEINQLKDTLIDGTYLIHVEIKSNKRLKYQKRKKIVRRYLIIEKDADFIPSYLVSSALVYNLWKKSSLVIKGKITSTYDLDLQNKIVAQCNYNYIKSDKNITIPKECDYTLKENKLRNKLITQRNR